MRVFLMLLACLVVTACSGVEIKQGEKSHARREIPPGPGVLTGAQGEFTIFRLKEKSPAARGEETPSE